MNSLQFNRHRRLRQSGSMRALVRETFYIRKILFTLFLY